MVGVAEGRGGEMPVVLYDTGVMLRDPDPDTKRESERGMASYTPPAGLTYGLACPRSRLNFGDEEPMRSTMPPEMCGELDWLRGMLAGCCT